MDIEKIKTIDMYDTKFQKCNFENIENGDIVMSSTMTFSQKYFDKNGFEEYNKSKIGIMKNKNIDDPENSVLIQYDNNTDNFFESRFYADPVSSGLFILYKYVE